MSLLALSSRTASHCTPGRLGTVDCSLLWALQLETEMKCRLKASCKRDWSSASVQSTDTAKWCMWSVMHKHDLRWWWAQQFDIARQYTCAVLHNCDPSEGSGQPSGTETTYNSSSKSTGDWAGCWSCIASGRDTKASSAEYQLADSRRCRLMTARDSSTSGHRSRSSRRDPLD